MMERSFKRKIRVRCCKGCPAMDQVSDMALPLCCLATRPDGSPLLLLHDTSSGVDESCPLLAADVVLHLDRDTCMCGENAAFGLPHKTRCPKAQGKP